MRLTDKKKELSKALEGFDNPALESALLIEKALSLTSSGQILNYDLKLSPEEEKLIDSLLQRRLAHEPAAYIMGEKEFYGLPFFVNKNVLIPRPDTETLVETALKFLKGRNKPEVLDLCAGSGCVGIAIAKNNPVALTLSDISEGALEVAEINAKALLEDKVVIVKSDLFDSFADEKFDLIVSNPPYLTEEWYEETEAEVKREPVSANLGFGEDGLELIRKIISESVKYLSSGAALALECDFRQTSECVTLMEINGFERVEVVKDLSGRERVVMGKYGNA